MIETLLDSLGRMLDPSSHTVYLIALVGGLLSSLLPCSLSSLPLVIGYVGSGRSDLWKSFRLSAVFALGMAVTFTLLAAAALALGSLIGTTSRWWYLILGLLMLMMALQMLGVFTFIPATNLQTRTKRRGYIGALVAGILSGLFSSPCSTPEPTDGSWLPPTISVPVLPRCSSAPTAKLVSSVAGKRWKISTLRSCWTSGQSVECRSASPQRSPKECRHSVPSPVSDFWCRTPEEWGIPMTRASLSLQKLVGKSS